MGSSPVSKVLSSMPTEQIRTFAWPAADVEIRIRVVGSEGPVKVFLSIPGKVQENALPLTVDLQPGAVFGAFHGGRLDSVFARFEKRKSIPFPDLLKTLTTELAASASTDLLARREAEVKRLEDRRAKAEAAEAEAKKKLEALRTQTDPTAIVFE